MVWLAGEATAFSGVVGGAVASGGSWQSPRGPEKSLLTFDGRRIAVRELLGLPYRQGLRVCRSAFDRWKLGAQSRFGYDIAPIDSDPGWKLPGRDPGRALYLRILQGLLDDFLRVQILNAAEKKFSPNLSNVVDLARVRSLAVAKATLDTLQRRLALRALREHWNYATYRRQFHLSFPAAPARMGGSLRLALHMLNGSPGFFNALFRAVPEKVGTGRVAPWVALEIRASLEPWIIGEILAEHKSRFTILAADKMGTWHFIAAGRVVPSRGAVGALRLLLQAASDARGPVGSKVVRAGQLLDLIGSPTRLMVGFGWPGYISQLSGAPRAAVRPLAMLPVHGASPMNPRFIYVSQKTPPIISGSLASFAPGRLGFVIGERAILGPIVRAVLSKAKPMVGLRLPSARWLSAHIALPQQSGSDDLGRILPKIILRSPWRDRR